jgi:hypothetical protein
MATCFVIQPFDGGPYDKRFKDVYEPAINAAGYDAYRVDQDPSVSVPIDAIENGIRNAIVCLADITTDNPNVWYELGFAFAAGRPVVMICAEDRQGRKFPFDIQHRSIIIYKAESTSDFEKLKATITERITAYVKKDEALQIMSDTEAVAPIAGLSRPELMVMAILAGGFSPRSSTGLYSAKQDAERAGVTSVGFNLGMRRLLQRGFIEETTEHEGYNDDPYTALQLTEIAWEWIETNESLFVLHRASKDETDDDIIPF